MPQRRPYQWNGKTARYRDLETGRFLSRDQVRLGLDKIVQASQARVAESSARLRSREIALDEWHKTMRGEIKRTMLASEALLRGGWKQMTNADYGRVGAHVRVQYRFLDNFVEQLREGDPRRLANLVGDAKLYPAAARVEFHEGQTVQLEALGFNEERNVLHPAEHCATCVDMSALGWVRIRTLIPVGQRQCRGNDRCSMRYRVNPDLAEE